MDDMTKAVTVARTLHCKIGRLRNIVTEDVKSYLTEHGVPAIKIKELCSHPGAPTSMHEEVHFAANLVK